jgi:hypothetical protein
MTIVVMTRSCLSQEVAAWGKKAILAVCECCQFEVSITAASFRREAISRDLVHFLLFKFK